MSTVWTPCWLTMALAAAPVALNSRTMAARPFSSGWTEVTITPAGSTDNSAFPVGARPWATTTTSGWLDSMPNRWAAPRRRGRAANGVTERGRPLLVGLVVRVPVVVHHPGIDGLRRPDVGEKTLGLLLESGQVRRQTTNLDQRGINRGPRHAQMVVRYVHESLDREPVLACAGNLIHLGPNHRPRDVHPHHALGHAEAEPEMHALLRANRLLIDHVDDFHAVQSVDNADLADQPVAAGGVGGDFQGRHQRAALHDANLHRAVVLGILDVSAGQIDVAVQPDAGRGIDEFLIAAP